MVTDQTTKTANASQGTTPHSADQSKVPDEVVQRVADLIVKKTQLQTHRVAETRKRTKPARARSKRQLSETSNGALTKKKDERQTPESLAHGDPEEWLFDEWADADSGLQVNLASQTMDGNG